MRFIDFIPVLLKASRFHKSYTPPFNDDYYTGRIGQAFFKIYKVNPHEKPGQQRKTGGGEFDAWVHVELNPEGDIDPELPYNPFKDFEKSPTDLKVLAFVSRVGMVNLSLTGQIFQGKDYGHFPMFDIVRPPSPANVQKLIREVKSRTLLEKFFVIKSSPNGMMVICPEVVNEDMFVATLFDGLLLNHVEEGGRDEYVVDDRWTGRSSQNMVKETGDRLNPHRYGGILRLTSVPIIKPFEPRIIASSF